jgi:di/tripeptidase
MISIGPEIRCSHSPDERVGIVSVRRFYEVLREIVATLA